MVGGDEKGGWRRFWELSRSERYGVAVLLVLMSGHLVFRFYEYQHPPDPPLEVVEWAREEFHGARKGKSVDQKPNSVSQVGLYSFIFEETDSADFVGMGLRPKTAASLQRYRERGGKIRSLRDWYALRALSEAEKERLAPYLQLPEKGSLQPELAEVSSRKFHRRDTSGSARPSMSYIPIRRWAVQELNRSDSAGWDAIPGVGPATARRIIEYRDRLGGYLHLSQLLEIYGMDSARYEALLPFACLEVPVNIRRISLNRCSEEELSSHPYAGRTMARRLIAFHERHGRLPGPDSLLQMRLYGVESEKLNRLLPYLEP